MIDWLKSKFLGAPPWKNKAGLPQAMVDLLVKDFSRLEQRWPGLPQRILTYALDDEGPEVLAELASLDGCGLALGLTSSKMNYYLPDISDRVLFFQQVESSDAAFFLRLSKIYDCASRLPRQHLLGLFKPGLEWLEVFLWEASNLPKNTVGGTPQRCPSASAELIEQMLALDGKRVDALVAAAFHPSLQAWQFSRGYRLIRWLPGFSESVARHRAPVDAALSAAEARERIEALTRLREMETGVEPFAERIVALAVGSSKTAREAAEPLVKKAVEVCAPLLEAKAVSGGTEERAFAAKLLWKLQGEARRSFLEARLSVEKTKSVADAIRDLLAVNAVSAVEEPAALPPLPELELNAPLDEETLAAWRTGFAELNKGLEALAASPHAFHQHQKFKPVPAEMIDKVFFSLQKPLLEHHPVLPQQLNYLASRAECGVFCEFWKRPEVSIVHVLRFCIITASFTRMDNPMLPVIGWWFSQSLDSFRETHPGIGLREVAGAFRAVGLDPAMIGRSQLVRFGAKSLSWTPDQIWPYWTEQFDVLQQYFQPAVNTGWSVYWKRNALETLAAFPQPPGRFAQALWDLALGTGKTDRALAQQCVEKAPDKLARIFAALASSNADVRAVAADWLRRMREPAAIEPLLAAMRKEKNEAAKGAILSALEQNGVPVEQFLDRAALLAEAKKGLAKGLPAALDWFPFDTLPGAHWADDGSPVAPEIPRWWLVQQCKLKNPEPGPLLRRYCSNLRAGEREALGQFVLDAWIASDIAPSSRAEAEQSARQHAQTLLQSAQWRVQHARQNPKAYPTPPPAPKTLEEYYAAVLPATVRQPKGSAIDSKGVLAVAAACGGAGLAPGVQRYLKQWYGMRPAQCRAMLQMLAWVDHSSAVQVLLATGSRFRTKGIQEEANKQAQTLAERKGWTLDELSDRTIPSAGLDEDGVLELDFGPRQFTARLNAECELTLFDPEGGALKSLPEPRKDDEEELAAGAKKLLSAAKKELKSVLTMQRERLYEAMCVQRLWSFEDWELFINRHPILRHYTQRLVWAVFRDGEAGLCFRPLPDGALTGAEDETVKIEAQERVGLAHERSVSAETSSAWRKHLSDYEVEPLFEQFGKPTFTLNDEQRRDFEIGDFRGHLVEAFKLRGRATKLGYTRGQAQDGGWFYEYSKRFPSLGLEAVITFTGNSLPEENRTVALETTRFQRVAPQDQPAGAGNAPSRVKLADLPAVLLSECWNDLRQLAAEGPGFDGDWEKKAAY